MDSLDAVLAIQADDHIGEGPAWDAASGRLLWVDHAGRTIHAATAAVAGWRKNKCWTVESPLAAAIPRTRGGLVVAGGNEIVLMSEAGETTPFARLDIDTTCCRINDLKCDARGRLWATTLDCDFAARGGLWRIDPDGTARAILTGYPLANGFDWSADGGTFYLIDSVRGTLEAFDFDVARGTLASPRVVITVLPQDGPPNGMTVDRDNGLWVAHTTGGEVRRYRATGELLARVRVAVAGVTSCAFGGRAGEELFITTRRGRVPEIMRRLGVPEARMTSSEPQAGGLFVCRPGVTGPAATAFPG